MHYLKKINNNNNFERNTSVTVMHYDPVLLLITFYSGRHHVYLTESSVMRNSVWLIDSFTSVMNSEHLSMSILKNNQRKSNKDRGV